MSVINKSWKANVSDLTAEYTERLEAFFHEVGNRYYVLSGYRSKIHQAALYRGWQLGLPGFNPANPPGTSKHELGTATDVHPTGSATFLELHDIAHRYGFHFPIKREPWHMELRPGRGPLSKTKEEAMGIVIEPVAAIDRPDGGGYAFGRRGHVYAFEGAPHRLDWGWDKDTRSNAKRCCVALVPTEVGEGLWLVSNLGEIYAYGNAPAIENYRRKEWGDYPIIGAFRNDRLSATGGLTLIRDDGKKLNTYALPA